MAAEDQLKRVDIRAPQDGVVHQLAVHTVGGVVSPGDPIMLIVPEADALAVEAKVSPQDIDQLQVGQPAGLRFSAFNQRTTPEINGTISRISADVSVDQRSGQSFYTIRIGVSPGGDRAPGQRQAGAGNAGRDLHEDLRPQRHVLFHQTTGGPGPARVPGTVTA